MSIARANGEQWDAPRSAYDELSELETIYLRSVRKGRKYFAIFRMRIEWKWSWRAIGETLSLNHGHCSRVFRQTKNRLQRLGEENRAGVAQLRVVTAEDDEDDQAGR